MLTVLLADAASAQVAGPFIGIPNRTSRTPTGQAGGDQFSISTSVSALYDSNMLRLNKIRAGDGPLDDVRVTPALTASVRQGFARNTVSLSGNIGYDFYNRYKGLERLRANLSGGASVAVGARCQISPSGDLQIQQAEIEDVGVPVGRTVRIVTGQVIVRCPRSVGFYPAFSTELLRLNNLGDAPGVNRRNWSATGGIVYALPSLGQLQLFANAGQFRRSSLEDSSNTGADITSIGLQFDRAITSRFATRLSVSGIRVDPRRASGGRFEGINYTADVRIAPIPSIILSPLVSRQIIGSINAGSDYVLAREASLGLDWSVGARTGIVAQVGRNRRRYFGEDPLIRQELRIADTTDVASIGVRYALRSFRLQLGAARRERDSRNDFYDFSSTRVEFSARAGF